MARKDKPYLPLYVQDFMTDEKLNECSAATTGVYIKIMCVMHKSEQYGTILLKQKDKQKDKQIENFALKIAKHISFDLYVILAALEELINEEVLYIDGDLLIQKRMYNDGCLSIIRSESGSEGGKSTQNKNKFALANLKPNHKANSDIEIDIENKKGGTGENIFGIEFINGSKVKMSDGSIQKLGKSQKLRVFHDDIKPEEIIKDKIY